MKHSSPFVWVAFWFQRCSVEQIEAMHKVECTRTRTRTPVKYVALVAVVVPTTRAFSEATNLVSAVITLSALIAFFSCFGCRKRPQSGVLVHRRIVFGLFPNKPLKIIDNKRERAPQACDPDVSTPCRVYASVSTASIVPQYKTA